MWYIAECIHEAGNVDTSPESRFAIMHTNRFDWNFHSKKTVRNATRREFTPISLTGALSQAILSQLGGAL